MPRITVSISDEQDERLEEIAGDGPGKPYSSKSAAVRAFLDGDEGIASLDEADELRDALDALRDERDALADRVSELERENERLQRERRQILEQREENTELVEYAKEQRSLERRHAERQERLESANIVRRGWWWIAGKPSMSSAED